ncbi:MAG: hypothetical protein QF619_11130, partial [Candidatus Binatia bacterium]|nr:hypothetical protein [Candidatus Binatia bacterium]
KPGVFVMEGLVGYLNAEAVDRLLRFIASFTGSGSSLIFDYTNVQKTTERFADLLEKLEESGERRNFGFDPNRLPEYLMERGYREVVNVSTDDLVGRYCPGRLKPSQTYYLATAVVC